jgi:hypothetical protein
MRPTLSESAQYNWRSSGQVLVSCVTPKLTHHPGFRGPDGATVPGGAAGVSDPRELLMTTGQLLLRHNQP